jgi:small subunit ribosomal protein S6
MAHEAPLYDLVLLLSTSAEDAQRTKILADVESTISAAGGSIERNDKWGQRPMAYEIRHQPEAEYHLLQFRAPGSLIEELSHNLRITDGVLRFRVIKVRPGTPDAPSSPPPVVAAASAHAGASASAGPSGAAGASGAGAPRTEPASSRPEGSGDADSSGGEDGPGGEEAATS